MLCCQPVRSSRPSYRKKPDRNTQKTHTPLGHFGAHEYYTVSRCSKFRYNKYGNIFYTNDKSAGSWGRCNNDDDLRRDLKRLPARR